MHFGTPWRMTRWGPEVSEPLGDRELWQRLFTCIYVRYIAITHLGVSEKGVLHGLTQSIAARFAGNMMICKWIDWGFNNMFRCQTPFLHIFSVTFSLCVIGIVARCNEWQIVASQRSAVATLPNAELYRAISDTWTVEDCLGGGLQTLVYPFH